MRPARAVYYLIVELHESVPGVVEVILPPRRVLVILYLERDTLDVTTECAGCSHHCVTSVRSHRVVQRPLDNRFGAIAQRGPLRLVVIVPLLQQNHCHGVMVIVRVDHDGVFRFPQRDNGRWCVLYLKRV